MKLDELPWDTYGEHWDHCNLGSLHLYRAKTADALQFTPYFFHRIDKTDAVYLSVLEAECMAIHYLGGDPPEKPNP